jgi:hypothetical protein
MQASAVFLEEFRRRGERASTQRIGRQETLSEAAHDAYQAATDRLTREHGWDDERALVVMRGLNTAVARWLDGGGSDWAALEGLLRRQEEAFTDGAGGSPRGLEGGYHPPPAGARPGPGIQRPAVFRLAPCIRKSVQRG